MKFGVIRREPVKNVPGDFFCVKREYLVLSLRAVKGGKPMLTISTDTTNRTLKTFSPNQESKALKEFERILKNYK